MKGQKYQFDAEKFQKEMEHGICYRPPEFFTYNGVAPKYTCG